MSRLAILSVWIGVLAISATVLAQAGPGGGGGGGGPVRIMGGPPNPAQFRQQQLDTIREKLALSDDEWNTLSPKIEKVMDAQRNAGTGAGMSFTRNFGGPKGNGQVVSSTGGGNMDTPAGKIMQELRKALEDPDAPADGVAKKLAAMREARDKARAELDAARKELKDSITPRQEAILVTLGVLE